MLHISSYENEAHISLKELRQRKQKNSIRLEDSYCLYEYFKNTIFFAWETEEGISEIDIKLPREIPARSHSDKTTWGYYYDTLKDGQLKKDFVLPSNFAGIVFEAYLTINGETYPLHIEVGLKKLTEVTFYNLLNNLREMNISIYDKLSPAKTFIGADRLAPFSNLVEQYESLKSNFSELRYAVERIAESPRKRLIDENKRELLFLAHEVSEDTIYDMCAGGGRLTPYSGRGFSPSLEKRYTSKKGRKYIPEDVIVPTSRTDNDVFENQLLKRFLSLVAVNMRAFRSMMANDTKIQTSRREEILRDCDEFVRDSISMLRFPFLDEVSEARDLMKTTLALRRDVQYMRFYDIFKKFISYPYYDRSKILDIPIEKICDLYEYWCCAVVFKVLLSLKDEGWEARQSFLETDELEMGFETKIRRNRPILTLIKGRERIELIFQYEIKSFIQEKTSGKPNRPDMAVMYYKNDRFANMVILDAKYRKDLFQEDVENSTLSAINSMHKYRDAFRDKNGARMCGWAIILYPGTSREGKAHQYHHLKWTDGDNKSGIAAICLRPDNDIEEQKNILLKTVIFSLFNGSVDTRKPVRA